MNSESSPFGLLFDTSDFPARWHCGRWTDLHGWTHVSADIAIAGAYAAIPVVLLSFTRKRRDVPFLPIFSYFAVFILSCGIVHLVEASIFWRPWYRFSAAMKVFTAVASWATVFELRRVVPQALKLPGLARMNRELKREADERRLAEERLRMSQERFELAVAGSNDGIWDWNVVTGEDYFSDRWCELLGYQPGELRTHVSSWSSLIHPEDEERVKEAVRQHLEERKPYHVEMRMRTKDGDYRWYLARGQAIWDEAGNAIRMAGSLSDVTERRAAEAERESLLSQLRDINQRLEQQVEETAALNASLEAQVEERTRSLETATRAAENSNRAKSRFLANMSHEIRTPMNAVQGLLQLLRRTSLSARQTDYVSQAQTAATNLMGVLNDILDLTKIEAGKLSISRMPFSTRTLFSELAALPPTILGEKDVDVVFDIQPTLPNYLMGDPLRIRQILLNLLSNAIKFTDSGEVVLSVRGECKGKFAELTFELSDTGVGMTDEELERVFRPFEQAEHSENRRFGGTGLGLAITLELVKMMGGKLSATSELGVGSRFRWNVQLEVEKGGNFAEKSETPVSWILVAESGGTSRKIHAHSAALLSQDVRVELNASNLVALVKSAPRSEASAVLLVDARMVDAPLLETLRAEAPHVEIILVSQQHLPSDDSLSHYCRRTVVKPLTPMRLEHVLEATRSKDDPTSLKEGSGSVEQSHELDGIHVLVVDDVDTNLLIAEHILLAHGATVTTAASGAEAIRLAHEASPQFNIILMDVQMPEMDGYAATREIREQEDGTRIPILALTANALDADVEASKKADLDDHLSKPLDAGLLVEKVAHWARTALG